MHAYSQLDVINQEGITSPEVASSQSKGGIISSRNAGTVATSPFRVVAVASNARIGRSEELKPSKARSGNHTSSSSSNGASWASDMWLDQQPALRPAGNPAADAPLAAATPLLGSPEPGSIIPGRFLVFFHSNVSSVQSGLVR